MRKRKELEDWQQADAARLYRLFRDRAAGLTQEAFGAKYGIGTQGMVSQYLLGRAPLGLPAALRFAQGLGVSLHEISPTFNNYRNCGRQCSAHQRT
jgi:transcriptional regulator with XRE-family HTH domain